MNRDLFLAILAMDSYNRGYGQGISGLSSTGAIGSATIQSQSDVHPGSDAVNAGFYAIAYTWNGETIISYRGTDNPEMQDAVNGYTVAMGNPYGSQATMAKDFYTAVTGAASPYDAAANTTLIGHSLGGGLAGLVSSISGTNSLLFNHMPFGVAAYLDELAAGPGGQPARTVRSIRL